MNCHNPTLQSHYELQLQKVLNLYGEQENQLFLKN